jgi:ABC-type enterochelin transport system permease subunit
MSELLVQTGVLVVFCLLMLLINIKTGLSYHWSGKFLKVLSFWLIVASIGALTFDVFQVVFRG